jgi:hypothetical protein
MAGDKGDQGSKEEIAEGMSEAGKGQVKGGGEPGRSGPGHGADPGQLTEGMSEAGSGVPTGGEAPEDKSGGTSR